jgi:fructose-1,6-bisphosphatase/sedoheptulose 1,7-bisphosphatase-like protein
MADERKADVVLSDGREITFDLTAVTYGEILGMVDPLETATRTDETVGRTAGMTLDEVKALTGRDFKKLIGAFWKKWHNPLSDPND